MPQIVLNLLLSIFYTGAVLLTPHIGWESSLPDRQVLANMYASTNTMHFNRLGLTNGLPHQILLPGRALVPPPGSRSTNILANLNEFVGKNHGEENNPADDIVDEQLVLRVAVLWLLTLCCYGTQLLLERQRQATLEAAEFATREGQLHAAGRLAAEFAHQIKNPLAIINNAAFSLQRTLRDPKNSAALQIEIIQEEVARADKVITQIMGYAQLSEGRVEKLRVVEEIERACEQVLPGAMTEGIQLRKKLTGPFPPLLMQRGHLSEILLNLLLNAREALAGHGTIQIAVSCNPDQDVVISVADDGPGIPPDQVGRIFEAYFTTKEKGTGLGLAIVKHNAELYGGRIAVDSVLGNGAKFTVTLPAKSKPQPFPK
jgi:signal transduction histidine kinase